MTDLNFTTNLTPRSPTHLDLQILEKARELLTDASKWHKGSYAIDNDGDIIEPWHPEAKCFCAWGAIAAAGNGYRHDTEEYISQVTERFTNGKYEHAPSFNDDPDVTHEDILALFDFAIQEAKNALQG